MFEPTIVDVLKAARTLRPRLSPTPLRYSPALSELLGADVYLKHEHHLPTGAFKVRGGINLISQMDPAQSKAGVLAASTGNHGQSIAYAARLFSVPATVYAPEGANPGKVAAMREMGAEVVLAGRDFDEARAACEQAARESGRRYIHSGDEPLLIAGVGTHTLEILQELPDADVIIVPIGGGSGAAGACITAKAINHAIKVIGVQSAQAPAAMLSWSEGARVAEPSKTWADGLATGSPFDLPQRILRRLLDDFLLVDDEELYSAVSTLMEKARVVVEGAAAASLAAALKWKDHLAGKKVVLILTGGNISTAQLREVLARTDRAALAQ